MALPDLNFQDCSTYGGHWTARAGEIEFSIERDGSGGFLAVAMVRGVCYVKDAVTSDGAMLACRLAVRDGIASWQDGTVLHDAFGAPFVEPGDAEVNAVADDARRYCHACSCEIDTHGERQRGMCVGCSDDSAVCRDWRLAVVDEDGAVTWTGSGWDYVQSNQDDLAAVLRLRVGLSFDGGGGAAPWYAVVRLPNDDG
jgi:hypothetical protein